MAKIYTFHAPKTAGNSLIALNAAIAYQHQNPDQKVLLFECSENSDLRSYTNLEHDRCWNDLTVFYGTPQWGPSLVHEVKANLGVDILFSRLVEPDFVLEPLWDLVEGEYDVVFVDLSRGFHLPCFNFFLAKADHLLLISCLDPLSLKSLENFWEDKTEFHYKMHLCINQCPKNGIKSAQSKAQKLGVPLVHVFPFDELTVWKQVFESVPVVVQQKSLLAKSIGNFVIELGDL